jgi:hypothetical protein
MENFVRIKVTMEVEYFVPMQTETVSKVNGWTLEEVIDDWFTRHNINHSHATRDYSLIGNSKKILSTEILRNE